MINEVMREIAEAEKKAEEIVAAARLRARDISLGAQSEIEEMKREYVLRLKEEQLAIKDRAEKEGNERAEQLLKDKKAEIAALSGVNERTFFKCVEQIAEKISKA